VDTRRLGDSGIKLRKGSLPRGVGWEEGDWKVIPGKGAVFSRGAGRDKTGRGAPRAGRLNKEGNKKVGDLC